MKIAYLGIPGSNSYAAAEHYFGKNVEYIGYPTFRQMYEAVTNKQVDTGIVPVENTLAGSVYENYDLLNTYAVQVKGEYYLKFENHLLGLEEAQKNNDLSQIKKVYSHPQPLMQCEKFFNIHPWIEKIVTSDTAAAAKYVSEQKNATYAAIGNREAATLYGLSILQEYIADDNDHNVTRFLVISPNFDVLKDANKCSIIFTLPHIPGSLYMALGIFSDNKMNLTKIESRPIHGKPFEYNFYVDLEFNNTDMKHIVDVFENQLPTVTQTLKVLGFYKSARLIE